MQREDQRCSAAGECAKQERPAIAGHRSNEGETEHEAFQIERLFQRAESAAWMLMERVVPCCMFM